MSELQRKLDDARMRSANGGGYPRISPRPQCAPVIKASEQRAEPEANAGPPFYNRAYVVSVWSKGLENVTRRFVSEAFNAFDADKDGQLSAAEFSALVRGFHEALRLPVPPESMATRLRGSAHALSMEAFGAVFQDLHKGVVFKIRIAGAEAPAEAPAPARTGWFLSECPSLPIDTRVEIISYRRCLPEFSAGAKRLRLKRFKALEHRVPPRDGLTVVGSYLHTGAPVGILQNGAYVVAVRNEGGEEYLVDSRGLRPAALSPDEQGDAGEGRRRGREVAAELGKCLTVKDVSRKLERANCRALGSQTDIEAG